MTRTTTFSLASPSAPRRRRNLKTVLLWAALAILWATHGFAHPLDEVQQKTEIQVARERFLITVNLRLGGMFTNMQPPDANRDGDFTAEEERAYIQKVQKAILPGMKLTVGDRDVPLTFQGGEVLSEPPFVVQVVLKIELDAPMPDLPPGQHRFTFTDTNFKPPIKRRLGYRVHPSPFLTTRPRIVDKGRAAEFLFRLDKKKSVEAGASAAPVTPPDAAGGPASPVIGPALPPVASADEQEGDGGWSSEAVWTGGERDDASRNEQESMLGYIQEKELSLAFVLFALAASFVFGMFHALSPGHGKAMVAAYLVGSRGRVRDAVFLGAVVTFTHVFSVFLLGFGALLLSQFIVPEALYPWLGAASGALIFCVGYWMLARRALGLGGHSHSHDHGHKHDHGEAKPKAHTHNPAPAHAHDHGSKEHSHADHEHGHDHEPESCAASSHSPKHEHSHDHSHDHGKDHGHDHPHSHAHDHGEEEAHDHGHSHEHAQDHSHDHGHSHGPGGHHHHLPPGEVTLGSLLSLGISGGMVPCPSALVVLLAAFSLNRILYGMALIVVFSVGLAAVLIAIGVLSVTVSGWAQRIPAAGGWIDKLPVASAGIVMVVGVGVAFQALLSGGVLAWTL